MDRDRLEALCREHDLPQLIPLLRPSVRLIVDPALPPVGRLGGSPAVPAGFEWPWTKGAPELCLGTFDGAAIHALLPGTGIAPTGFTSFFYDATLGSDVIDPASQGWHRVVTERDEHRLDTPRLPPDPRSRWQRFREGPSASGPWSAVPALHHVDVGGLIEWTLPVDSAPEVAVLDLDYAAEDRRYELFDAMLMASADGPEHRVGGWPNPVQADPRPDPSWRQLLQIDSDEDRPGIMWGDAGAMHVIEREDDPGSLRMEWQCA